MSVQELELAVKSGKMSFEDAMKLMIPEAKARIRLQPCKGNDARKVAYSSLIINSLCLNGPHTKMRNALIAAIKSGELLKVLEESPEAL
jgi:hypothetical protein